MFPLKSLEKMVAEIVYLLKFVRQYLFRNGEDEIIVMGVFLFTIERQQ